MTGDRAGDPFEEPYRSRLVGLAYRLLGSRTGALEVVRAAARERRGDDGARARTAVTRLALETLRTARAQRETYAGPWLPEPLVGEAFPAGTAAERSDDVSFALLLALERLSPPERAAFVLHDVFDVPFGEIGRTLDREEHAVRQLAARARTHVRESLPHAPPDAAEAQRIVDAFGRAAAGADVAGLYAVLGRHVVARIDTGGSVAEAIKPVVGVDHVARLVIGLAAKRVEDGGTQRVVMVNGSPGVALEDAAGALEAIVAFTIDAGLIVAVDTVRTPAKRA